MIKTPVKPATCVFSPFVSLRMQRKCACGGTPGSTGECEACRRKPCVLQTKLRINQPGDRYEQEAVRIAEAVGGGGRTECGSISSLGTRTGFGTAEQPGKQVEDGTIQRKAFGDHAVSPPIVEDVLQSAGEPLEARTREFFEERLGYDFGQVRVHRDAPAAQSARAVNASAYTVGHDVVFDSGGFAPDTETGRRLLAHELVHVVQQSRAPGPGGRFLQRAPEAPTARQDVVLLLTEQLRAEAPVIAPGAPILSVHSVDDIVTKLQGVHAPIGTLYILSHSNSTADLIFTVGNTTKVLSPSELSAKLKGVFTPENAPQVVNFRGCRVGLSPEAMDQVREAVGAKSVIAATCFSLIQTQGPVTLGGVPITRPSQLTSANRANFETGLQRLVDNFGMAKDCVLDRSEQAYFQANGRLVARWFSPEHSTTWDPRTSVCYNDLVPETVDPRAAAEDKPIGEIDSQCRLVRVGQ
jgi:Domain of unknown function (DUF4157)